jgi:hypothetical protein
MQKFKTIILLVFLTSISCFATTWDEPWQEEIIKQSEYFIFGKVIEASDSNIVVAVEKSFGAKPADKIVIDDFFMLQLCSLSGGDNPGFSFEPGNQGYFFLKKGENGNYQMPTPTSGFAGIIDGKVHATYRHSYHMAAVPIDVFELTYNEIWSKFRKATFDTTKITQFINENLSHKPAGFSEDEIDLFFLQHASLETAFLCGIPLDFQVLKKIADSDNFHSGVSALMAFANVHTEESVKYLFKYITDNKKKNFHKVIAIWTLWGYADDDIRQQLVEMTDQLSDEDTGFGANIMDPRICTFFPTPKGAVKHLEEQ